MPQPEFRIKLKICYYVRTGGLDEWFKSTVY